MFGVIRLLKVVHDLPSLLFLKASKPLLLFSLLTMLCEVGENVPFWYLVVLEVSILSKILYTNYVPIIYRARLQQFSGYVECLFVGGYCNLTK